MPRAPRDISGAVTLVTPQRRTSIGYRTCSLVITTHAQTESRMLTLSRILVDIDAIAPAHPALEQAVALAARSGAALTIVDVLPYVPSGIRHYVTTAIETELVEHRESALRSAAASVRGATATSKLLRGRPAHALIDEVQRARYDLVVRSHARDLAPGTRPFGAIDMELLRHCPAPVWLVGREHRAGAPWRILAAVHAEADGSSTPLNHLNHAILDWALSLRALTDGQLTVMHAWAPFGASVLQTRMSATEFAAFAESGRAHEQHVLHALLAPYHERLGGAAIELIEDEPDHAIAEYVDTHSVDIVVMGTVARSGIAGLVMGNTAERVLRRLRGSVLAIKPAGFRVA
jgi:nucleotide-binding universal stress UspA family protein